MDSEKKQVRYDVDGADVLTATLRELINQYPGLDEGDEIAFSTLEKDSGKAMFPVSGSVIESDKEDILGHVTQICVYPFFVIYRAAGLNEDRKASVKEWLDNLGKWLERQPVRINNAEFKLDEYPKLTGNRKILSISRQSPGYLDTVNDNLSENWAIQISARYRNEFNK